MFFYTKGYYQKLKYLYNDIDSVNCIAIIESNKIEKENSNKYICKVKYLNKSKKYKNTKLILYTGKNEKFEYGDIVKITGKFSLASENRNYKGFNYRRNLWQENIYGILIEEKIEKVGIKKSVFKIINNIKLIFENNILITNMNNDYKEFLKGVLLGNTDNISDEIKENFKDASLSHILAISGMHISYIVLIINFILKKVNSKKVKGFLCFFILNLYIIIIGSTPSSIRALIMYTMIYISEIFYRKSNSNINLILSIIILLIINPFNIENIGLWLSHLGTYGIIEIYNKFNDFENNKIKKYILNNLKLSFSVQICIFPILVYNFNTISLTFFVSNLIISFFIGPIILIGFFIMFFGKLSFIANFFSVIEAILLNQVFELASFISKLSISKIYVKTPSVIFIFLYYILLILIMNYNKELLKFFKTNIKKLSVIIIFLIIIFNYNFNRELKIYFVDVGQGDCTLIKSPKGINILIDGGEDNQGALFSYLLDRKVSKIDYIFISHFDSDHWRFYA